MPQLPELVEALLKPKAYPETPQRIELLQTQMSFVFLTDNYVYKVKKPVNLGYLDYTTLDKRRFYCQREVELNRRLCSNAYLGVVSIIRDKGGIFIGGPRKSIGILRTILIALLAKTPLYFIGGWQRAG